MEILLARQRHNRVKEESMDWDKEWDGESAVERKYGTTPSCQELTGHAYLDEILSSPLYHQHR